MAPLGSTSVCTLSLVPRARHKVVLAPDPMLYGCRFTSANIHNAHTTHTHTSHTLIDL